jgi:hypothetical protein
MTTTRRHRRRRRRRRRPEPPGGGDGARALCTLVVVLGIIAMPAAHGTAAAAAAAAAAACPAPPATCLWLSRSPPTDARRRQRCSLPPSLPPSLVSRLRPGGAPSRGSTAGAHGAVGQEHRPPSRVGGGGDAWAPGPRWPRPAGSGLGGHRARRGRVARGGAGRRRRRCPAGRCHGCCCCCSRGGGAPRPLADAVRPAVWEAARRCARLHAVATVVARQSQRADRPSQPPSHRVVVYRGGLTGWDRCLWIHVAGPRGGRARGLTRWRCDVCASQGATACRSSRHSRRCRPSPWRCPP